VTAPMMALAVVLACGAGAVLFLVLGVLWDRLTNDHDYDGYPAALEARPMPESPPKPMPEAPQKPNVFLPDARFLRSHYVHVSYEFHAEPPPNSTEITDPLQVKFFVADFERRAAMIRKLIDTGVGPKSMTFPPTLAEAQKLLAEIEAVSYSPERPRLFKVRKP